MKRKSLILLFSLISSFISLDVFASFIEVDGFYYNFDSSAKTAEVTFAGDKYDDYSNEYTGSIVIPSSVVYNGVTYNVTSISDYAFASCQGITTAYIPSSITSLGKYAFSSCPNLTSVSIDSKWIIEKNYTLGTGFNSIFGGQVKEYIFGKNVKRIGNYAFCYCTFTSITIPNSVTSIGEFAFSHCMELTTITIPESVTSIESYAFEDCLALTSFTLPSSVTSLGYSIFAGCSSFNSINVNAGNTKYDSRDHCNAIIETASNTLITGCKNTIIPHSVMSIGRNAFNRCSGLTSIIIPSNVKSMMDGAFNNCI